MVSVNRKPRLEQVDPPQSPRDTLPTMYDLPSENPEEPGLPDEFHVLQPQFLTRTLQLSAYPNDCYFTAADLNLYYDVNHPLWYKRPDWFLAVDVPRLYEGTDLRRSYVVWQEGKSPYVTIEFLSPGTENEDLGRFGEAVDRIGEAVAKTAATDENQPNGGPQITGSPPAKLEVYERYLRIPHYLVYDRYAKQLRYFKLEGGRYQEQSLNSTNPRVWLADLEVGLGLWQGTFEAVPGDWLRWCDRKGNWLLTDTEQIQAQLLQAARNLMATGLDLEQASQLLNLSADQISALQTAISDSQA